MLDIVLTRNAALGNGNRKQGDVLGQIEKPPGEAVHDAIRCSTLADLESRTGIKAEAADGVEDLEIITALINGLFRISKSKPDPVEAKPIEEAAAEPAEDVEDAGLESDSDDDSIESLGLTQGLADALKGAGLDTITRVIEFGVEHDGLESIAGIGPTAEGRIVKAIEGQKSNATSDD
jgi:hypothetical protein